MAGQFTSTNRIVAVKEETSPGVFQEMAQADYKIEFLDAETMDFDFNPERPGKVARGDMAEGQSFSTFRQLTGYTLNTLWRHDGLENTFPTIDPLLKAAGLIGEVVGGKARYSFKGIQPCKTFSIQSTELNCGETPDGIMTQARGCVPNLVISADGIGQQVKLGFEVVGAYENELDVANPIRTLEGYATGATEKLMNTTFQIGATPFILHSYNLNLNNNTVIVPDPSKPGCIYQGKVVGADPVLTATVQMIDLATSGLDDALAGDLVFDNITINGLGWDIVITEGNIRNLTKGDADNIMTQELEIELRRFHFEKKEYVS